MSRATTWTGRCWAIGAALGAVIAAAGLPADASSWVVPLAGGSIGQGTAGTLSAPASVTATCGAGTTVLVSWSDVTGAATFTIQQSTTSSTSGFTTVATGVTGTTWTSPSLGNSSYWYKVVAVNAAWSGPPSTATARRKITGGTCS